MSYNVDRFIQSQNRSIVLGLHSKSAPDEYSQEFEDIKIISHEEYGSIGRYDHDIMLIKLAQPVEFNEAVSPICLPSPGDEFSEGMRCYTTGWGDTSCEIRW